MIRAIPQPLVSPLVTPLVAAASSQTIFGFAYPGETLSMQGGAASYQWFVNSDNRGTAQTLLLTVDDIGKTVTGIRNGRTLPTRTVWKPQDVSGVAMFYWARAGVLSGVSPDVTATDGQGVRRWVGQVSGGPADQTLTGRQPAFRATGLNGAQSINPDGTDDVLGLSGTQLDLFRNKTYGAIIAVCQDTNHAGGASTHSVAMWGTGGTTLTRLAIVTRNGGAQNFAAAGRRTDTGSSTVAQSSSNGDANVLVAEAVWGSGILNLRVNGTQTATANFASGSGSTNDTASGHAGIGAFNDGTPSNPFPGHIAALICLNSQPSATDMSRLERFGGLLIGRNIPLV